MPSLLHMPTRVRLVRRLERVRPDSIRLWGTMDAQGMLCHLYASLGLTFGEVRLPVRDSWMNRWYGRLLVIDSPLPWPRGRVQAPAELLPSPSAHSWDWDRNRVVEYVQRFSVGRHQTWGVHPLLGPLSAEQWGRFSWRHCDHHLRQFAC
jgi:hypothetical protein